MTKFFALIIIISILISPVFAQSPGNNNENLSPLGKGVETSSDCGEFLYNQATELKTGDGPKGVAAADLDGDGLVDVAASFQMSSVGFSVLRNLGGNRFAPKIDFTLPPATSTAEKVYIADIDRDGKLDVLLSSGLGSRLSIYRNLSTGPGDINFGARTEFTTGSGQRALAIGDFDGDGALDIGASNKDAGTFSVLRNVSSGPGNFAFAPKIDYAMTTPGYSVVGDFNGDGKLDIAVGSTNTSAVRVLVNTSPASGSISFAVSPIFDLPNSVNSITAADLDGDGKLDLAVTISNGNTFSLLRNTGTDGNLNFAARQSFNTGAAPFGIVAVDLDGDGKKDIATANANGNSVSVHLNTSVPGTFSFAARAWDFGTGLFPYWLGAADINNDGRLDLLVPNINGNNVSILQNRTNTPGSVDFASRRDYQTPLQSGVTNAAPGDFDNDGKTDLAVSFEEIRNSFRFSIYVGNGTGHFAERRDFAPVGTGITAVEPYYISTGDFDHDGRSDVVMVGNWRVPSGITREGLVVFRNTSAGPGSFGFVATYSFEFESPKRVFTTDLDADGFADIVATHNQAFSTETALIFRNNGAMDFTQSGSFAISGSTISLLPASFADLNADGRTDIVYTTTFPSNNFRVQVNTSSTGNISFVEQNFPTTFTPSAPVPADIDGDGRPELVSSTDQKMYVFKNTSQGGVLSFDAPLEFPTTYAVRPVRAADLDGDEKTDIIAQNLYLQWGFNIIWKNTTANGAAPSLTEQPVPLAVGAANYEGALTGDLDNNGRMDIINAYNGQIGGFSVLLAQSCTARRSVPFDFDGDLKTDIGIFRPSDGSWWYSRSSDNAFRVFSFGTASDRLTPADFTGDGKSDIAVFRPSTGEWFVQRSEDNSFFSFPFGTSGDIPVPADFDGDGKSDAAVFRPSSATWFVLNSAGSGTSIVQFGASEDKPVPADYDGDGKADIGIFRPSDGSWWYLQSSNGQFKVYRFGEGTDKPVQGDYTGDGKADIAVFRPATGEWFFQRSEDNSYYSVPFGASGDLPAPGDYDGDGKFDTAIFRPSSNTWFIQRSTAGTLITNFGAAGDLPLPNVFVP